MSAAVIGTTVTGHDIWGGTSAERTTLGVKPALTQFQEIGGPLYESDGSAWNPISISGVALVTDGIEGASTTMLLNATGTGTSFSTQLTGAGLKSKARYSATLGANDTVAATATVKIYGSDTPMATAVAGEKYVIGTLTLSGTGVTDNDVPVSIDAVHAGEHYWTYTWMEVTVITGTGAKVQGRRFV
jgi:hypothetical protein